METKDWDVDHAAVCVSPVLKNDTSITQVREAFSGTPGGCSLHRLMEQRNVLSVDLSGSLDQPRPAIFMTRLST